MTPMSCPTLMLGDPTEESFVGHLRLMMSGPAAWISVAGRVAADAGAIDAFVPARRLEVTLRSVLNPLLLQHDRNQLLHQAWSTLAGMESVSLGPAGGANLSLLLIAGDARGVGVSATGMSMVWGRFSGRWRPLTRPEHPLLGAAGRPVRTPGVLGLLQAPEVLLGVPAHLPPSLPSSGVLRRAGVYR